MKFWDFTINLTNLNFNWYYTIIIDTLFINKIKGNIDYFVNIF